MSFQYKNGQVPFEEAKNHVDTNTRGLTLKDLLGTVSETDMFPISGAGKDGRENNMINNIRFAILSHVYPDTFELPLFKIEDLCFSELTDLKNVGKKTSQWLYELYASFAEPSINANHNTSQKPLVLSYSELEEINPKFCVFVVDHVTYIKANHLVIPFKDIISYSFVETKNDQFYIKIQYNCRSNSNEMDSENKIGDLLNEEIDVEYITEAELNKFLGLFKTFPN